MRITPLASGSLGNSLLVEHGGDRLLIDAGLEVSELEARLGAVGVRPRSVTGLFLTHRHKDHARAATEFSRRNKVPIFATRRTAKSVGSESRPRVRLVEPLRRFACGAFVGMAIPVEHDAPETMALLVEVAGLRYGHATDLGRPDGPIVDYLVHCDALLLEFNHDREMLWNGADPPHLKRRIASDRGHLSNEQAASLLARLWSDRLRHVWLAHLSRRNNRIELALRAARRAVDGTATLHVAGQDEPSPTVGLDA